MLQSCSKDPFGLERHSIYRKTILTEMMNTWGGLSKGVLVSVLLYCYFDLLSYGDVSCMMTDRT